ncbi:hypothetical protein P153DRAFT_369942 [Dothidotthia symphoricarpi CBS 119687]|uniref:Uncharacterized protein n=1 Tax=Dothidotthia symphoricarpi CBS 119687 TaxID=1392245 RepID=A0A6A6A0B0_9PLEO|nr:uncharacterized protein P153DRAFT_369942 [Dothidotthia symphoricarpi CBS 119687]KAF2125240.1 hypothetical protein P153DRAFT_369942 [Dothidotthia symphoricarpi CBS 119687]
MDATLPVGQGHKNKTITIEELRQDNKLWYKLHVFMFDLRNFRTNTNSRERLELVTNELFIGNPYFDDNERQRLCNTIIDSSQRTLEDVLGAFFQTTLEKRLQGRIKETGDWRICAAHDLAPIFERAFRVNTKDLSKNKVFSKMVQKGGLGALDNGGVWKGIGRR